MSVEKAVFGTLPDGREAALYTLRARSGMTLVTTPYGCRIIRLLVPDRLGRLGDVILGHRTLGGIFRRGLPRSVHRPLCQPHWWGTVCFRWQSL